MGRGTAERVGVQGRRCRRVWTALTVFPHAAAKIGPLWQLRWNAVLGGHAHGVSVQGLQMKIGILVQSRSQDIVTITAIPL